MNEDTAALIALLETTRRPSTRVQAVQQLAAQQDPDAAPTLFALLQESNDPVTIQIVTAALAGLQALGAAIAPIVVDALAGPPDERRPFAPLLLASALGKGALEPLVTALQDEQIAVRVNAATQLGQLGLHAAFEPLLATLEDPEQPAPVRSAAASALGSLRDRRAFPVLAALSSTDDPELLAGAIDGLAELRDPDGIPYLEAILERPNLDERTNRAVRLGLLAMERYRDH